MTNEELAVAIQAGDDGLMPQLWEQVRKLIVQQAERHLFSCSERVSCRVQVEDLIQSGYFAVVEAVRNFKPDSGYKFTTFLGFTLKNAFNTALGLRAYKGDAFFASCSLDTPIGEDEDTLLLEMIQDLSDIGDCESSVTENIWNQQLRAALDAAMEQLPDLHRKTLLSLYYFDMSGQAIADDRGCTREYISNIHNDALRALRYGRYRQILAEFMYEDAVIPDRAKEVKEKITEMMEDAAVFLL